jgi:hypothetical protein
MNKTTEPAPPVDLQTQLQEQRRKVDFDSYDISVQQLLSMVQNKQINVAPAYQRQYRWDATRRSRFIESILLGIPIPSLFMATNPDGTWELVDGVQRLSTLVHYAGSDDARSLLGMKSKLQLEGLEKLSRFRGPFDSLPKTIQLHFELRPIKVTTLTDKSDLVVRFDLFERLNTGGVALTDQEIRACIFRGSFNDFLERMANEANFKSLVKLPEAKQRDGTREEFVLRFFALLNNYKTFEHSVVNFLNSYMKAASLSFDYAKGETLFRKTFELLSKALPDGITRGRRITPVNLYEAVAVGAALALQKRDTLKTSGIKSWMVSEDLTGFTTAATNDLKRVVGRIEYCARKFGW